MNDLRNAERALKAIRSIVDCYFNGTLSITAENDGLAFDYHLLGIRNVMGMISNHAYGGLGLDIPDRMKKGSEEND